MRSNSKSTKEEYEKIIDAKTVSEILGVSRSTVYKMVERKLIDYLEYPNSIRFYEADILDYLKKHKIKAVKNFEKGALF